MTLQALPLNRMSIMTVAASNSSVNSKILADYVCDGTDDDVQIQAAIDEVSALWKKGEVRLSGGDYNCSSTINMKNQVSVIGEGSLQNTFITWDQGTDCDGFYFLTDASNTRGAFRMENITPVNNNIGDYWCINIPASGDALFDADFTRVYTQGGGGGSSWAGGGLFIGNGWSVRIDRCWFEHSRGAGLRVDNGSDLMVNDTLCAHNATYGARITGTAYCDALRCGNNSGGLTALDGNSTLTDTFTLGESVTQAVSGAKGVVSAITGTGATYKVYIAPRTFTAIFDSTNVITGDDSGATITASAVAYNDFEGMYLVNASNIALSNCFAYENYGPGIRFDNTDNCMVMNTRAKGNNRQARSSNEFGAGFSVKSNCSGIQMVNCVSDGLDSKSAANKQRIGFYDEGVNNSYLNCRAFNNTLAGACVASGTSGITWDIATHSNGNDFYSDDVGQPDFTDMGAGSYVVQKCGTVEMTAATYTLSHNETGRTMKADCSSNAIVVNLPPALEGFEYVFNVTDATNELRLNPKDTEYIKLANGSKTSAAGDYITNNTAKDVEDGCTIRCVIAGVWEHYDSRGTWTEE